MQSKCFQNPIVIRIAYQWQHQLNHRQNVILNNNFNRSRKCNEWKNKISNLFETKNPISTGILFVYFHQVWSSLSFWSNALAHRRGSNLNPSVYMLFLVSSHLFFLCYSFVCSQLNDKSNRIRQTLSLLEVCKCVLWN